MVQPSKPLQLEYSVQVDEDRARALLASTEGSEFRLDDDAQVGSS